ncbi:hypothetical protein KI387_036334, partial [Taxus chinensis]
RGRRVYARVKGSHEIFDVNDEEGNYDEEKLESTVRQLMTEKAIVEDERDILQRERDDLIR